MMDTRFSRSCTLQRKVMVRILTKDFLDPHGFSKLDEEQVDWDAGGDDAQANT